MPATRRSPRNVIQVVDASNIKRDMRLPFDERKVASRVFDARESEYSAIFKRHSASQTDLAGIGMLKVTGCFNYWACGLATLRGFIVTVFVVSSKPVFMLFALDTFEPFGVAQVPFDRFADAGGE